MNFTDPRGLAAVIINLGTKPIKSSYSTKGGQQIFFVEPGGTSLSTTIDPDTLIFSDKSVVKIPDGSIVVITDSAVLDTFEQSDLNYISPLGQLLDKFGILPKQVGPKLITHPEAEFGPFQCPFK